MRPFKTAMVSFNQHLYALSKFFVCCKKHKKTFQARTYLQGRINLVRCIERSRKKVFDHEVDAQNFEVDMKKFLKEKI